MILKKINWKKNKIELVFDESKFILDSSVYDDHYLYVGKDLSIEELNQLKEESDLSTYNTYLMRLIASKEYSKKELVDKLVQVKHIKKSLADTIISRLEEKELIDDQKYTLDLIREYHQKGYGEKWITSHLYEKGLDVKLFQLDEELEKKKALNWIEPLYNKCKGSSYKECSSKIYDRLYRLGFSSEIITYAIEAKLDRNEYPEKLYLEIELEKNMAKVELNDAISINKVVDKLVRKGYLYEDVKKMLGEKYGIVC